MTDHKQGAEMPEDKFITWLDRKIIEMDTVLNDTRRADQIRDAALNRCTAYQYAKEEYITCQASNEGKGMPDPSSEIESLRAENEELLKENVFLKMRIKELE